VVDVVNVVEVERLHFLRYEIAPFARDSGNARPNDISRAIVHFARLQQFR